MVAKHIAHDVKVPVHGHQTDEFGKPIVKVSDWKHRTAFQKLDFLEDDEDFTPSKIVVGEFVV